MDADLAHAGARWLIRAGRQGPGRATAIPEAGGPDPVGASVRARESPRAGAAASAAALDARPARAAGLALRRPDELGADREAVARRRARDRDRRLSGHVPDSGEGVDRGHLEQGPGGAHPLPLRRAHRGAGGDRREQDVVVGEDLVDARGVAGLAAARPREQPPAGLADADEAARASLQALGARHAFAVVRDAAEVANRRGVGRALVLGIALAHVVAEGAQGVRHGTDRVLYLRVDPRRRGRLERHRDSQPARRAPGPLRDSGPAAGRSSRAAAPCRSPCG